MKCVCHCVCVLFHAAINRALPNIHSYLCNVLKKESLSLEAEALRARYESMLMHLEKISQGDTQQNGGKQLLRHATVIGLRGEERGGVVGGVWLL